MVGHYSSVEGICSMHLLFDSCLQAARMSASRILSVITVSEQSVWCVVVMVVLDVTLCVCRLHWDGPWRRNQRRPASVSSVTTSVVSSNRSRHVVPSSALSRSRTTFCVSDWRRSAQQRTCSVVTRWGGCECHLCRDVRCSDDVRQVRVSPVQRRAL